MFSAKRALSDGEYGFEFDVPSNTTGTLVLPAVSTPGITLDGKVVASGVIMIEWGCYGCESESHTVSKYFNGYGSA